LFDAICSRHYNLCTTFLRRAAIQVVSLKKMCISILPSHPTLKAQEYWAMKTNSTKHVPVDPIAHAKPDNLWDPRQVGPGFMPLTTT
jgi:hypothetical protein